MHTLRSAARSATWLVVLGSLIACGVPCPDSRCSTIPTNPLIVGPRPSANYTSTSSYVTALRTSDTRVVNAEPTPVVPYRRSITSRQEFLSLSIDELKTVYQITDLDPNETLDAIAIAQLDDLMTAADIRSDERPALSWTSAGSFTHPDLGIALDKNQILRLKRQTGSDFYAAMLFVLAHEFGHSIQYKTYPTSDMGDPQKTRAIEAQADILAGLLSVRVMLLRRIPPITGVDAIQGWFSLAIAIGSPVWDDHTKHPTSPQRARLATLGLLAAFQFLDIHSVTNDENLRRAVLAARLRNPDLPTFGDNELDWSNAAAKRIVNLP